MLATVRLPVSGAAAQAGPALVATVTLPAQVPAAVAAGADLIDLGRLAAAAADGLIAAYPRMAFCAEHDLADAVRSARIARHTGAWLICGSPAAAMATGLPPHQLLVDVPPAGIGAALQAGLLPLVDADAAAVAYGPGGLVGTVALSAWLGAAAIRTSQLVKARRALDMVASIAGLRAPARTVRGLA